MLAAGSTAIPTMLAAGVLLFLQYVSCWEYCYSYSKLAAGSTAIPTMLAAGSTAIPTVC